MWFVTGVVQTLENLRNEHQAKDQKELAEHRKKQHDQQVAAMEEVGFGKCS